MGVFCLCTLGIFRKVWMAWICCNSHRACSGNCSFLSLEHAQLLSWRPLAILRHCLWQEFRRMWANSLSYLYHVSPSPSPDLGFFHGYEKRRFYRHLYSPVSPLMSWASIIFSIQCDNWVLRGISSMWWVTCLACFLSISLISFLCTALKL